MMFWFYLSHNQTFIIGYLFFCHVHRMILVFTFGATALFSLVTLPVEFDASNRALAWLDESGYMQGDEHDGAKDALW